AGIHVDAGTGVNSMVSGNVVGGTVPGSINLVSTHPYASVRGIQAINSAATVENNTVRHLTANGGTNNNSGTTLHAAITGIASTGGNVTLAGNSVMDLMHDGTTTPAYVYGIYTTGGSGTNELSGNTVRGLGATAASSYVRHLYGIYFNGTGSSNTVSGNFIDSLSVASGGSGAHNVHGLY